MQTTLKHGHVTFVCDDEFKGDVFIARATGESLTVPMEALRRIVAESLRAEIIRAASVAKPEALLRRPP